MKHVDEYRDRRIAEKLFAHIEAACTREVRLMEVCGTHTVAIFRSGIRGMLPANISLLSGPGCPVCVTANEDIDFAIEIARQEDVILATFGDMIKVPGSESSLEKERARGSDIRVVYSSLDALEIARQNPGKKITLLGIGFETTSPTIAAAVMSAEKERLGNFFVLTSHKLIPPAMKVLLDAEDVKIDGFLCPGHVSTIIGSRPYEFIPRDYGVPCVIAGFEPLDILQSILMLVQQIESGDARVENEYGRVVRPEGNVTALKVLEEVFEICDVPWRGLGIVPQSGMALREKYNQFDARTVFKVNVKPSEEPKGCLCGDILRGVRIPPDCAFFGKACTPDNPIGPCMVSSEGTCAAYFKYNE